MNVGLAKPKIFEPQAIELELEPGLGLGISNCIELFYIEKF